MQRKVEERAATCRGEREFVDARGVKLYSATGAVKANDWVQISKGTTFSSLALYSRL